MGNIVSGLEIANKRMKEKEEITNEITFWIGAAVLLFLKETEETLDIKFTPYDRQRALIKAHIIAEKKAEMILKNKKG